MSSVLHLSPSLEIKRLPERTIANYRGPLPASLPGPKSRILMVGRNTSWGAPLQSTLKKLGCDIAFAPSLRATIEYVRKGSYALLLFDSTVPAALRKQLVSGLLGSQTSVFQLFPVENGCWWLPVVLRGEECFGSPGFRTREFTAEMGRVLRDIQ